MLEMPPVMEERQEIDEIIEEKEELEQFSESNYVFTDISTSESDRVVQSLLSCKISFSVFFFSFFNFYKSSVTLGQYIAYQKMKIIGRWNLLWEALLRSNKCSIPHSLSPEFVICEEMCSS